MRRKLQVSAMTESRKRNPPIDDLASWSKREIKSDRDFDEWLEWVDKVVDLFRNRTREPCLFEEGGLRGSPGAVAEGKAKGTGKRQAKEQRKRTSEIPHKR